MVIVTFGTAFWNNWFFCSSAALFLCFLFIFFFFGFSPVYAGSYMPMNLFILSRSLVKSFSICCLTVEYFWFKMFSQSFSTIRYRARLALASITLECAPSYILTPRKSLVNLFKLLAPQGFDYITGFILGSYNWLTASLNC